MSNQTERAAPAVDAMSVRRPPPPPRKRVRPELYYRCRGAYYLRVTDGDLIRVNQASVLRRLKRLGFSLGERNEIIDELQENPISNPPQ